jgi:PadR family transcriptional regulator AphA
MSSRRKTHFALLGLLSWKPMSGYDIKKIVDVGLSHFWNENYGQIYPTLESLVAERLATKSIDKRGGKRTRHVYRITPNGVKAFRAWIEQPTDPPIIRNELQLKLFLGSQLPQKTSLRMIEEYRAQQQEVLQEYLESEVALRNGIQSGAYPDDVNEILTSPVSPRSKKQKVKQCNMFLLTLRHGILAIEARMIWCDEVVAYLTA